MHLNVDRMTRIQVEQDSYRTVSSICTVISSYRQSARSNLDIWHPGQPASLFTHCTETSLILTGQYPSSAHDFAHFAPLCILRLGIYSFRCMIKSQANHPLYSHFHTISSLIQPRARRSRKSILQRRIRAASSSSPFSAAPA